MNGVAASGYRMQEDLHTICTCSASFLHTSELPCCETRPKAAGGVGACLAARAGMFPLEIKVCTVLPVA
jgi:hypothetical protein